MTIEPHPNPFFVFGVPKSGTTWLQMLLDAHPEASCPSEHQIAHLFSGLGRVIGEYHALLKSLDERAARQGTRGLTPADQSAIARFIVERLVDAGRGGSAVRAAGIKDNTLLRQLPILRTLFPRAPLICMVRDPRAMILSNWRYNCRTEAGFLDRVGGFAEWGATIAKSWNADMTRVWQAAGNRFKGKGIMILRYEDLAGADGHAKLGDVLGHIGIAADPPAIDAMYAATDIDRLRRGPGGAFFAGATKPGTPEIDKPLAATIEALAAPMMAVFGYEPGAGR